MFTDVSSEAIAATLPLYVVFGLGLSPAAYGVVEAVYQVSSALVRLAGGFAADRMRRYKPAATLGYGMSAACKIGYLAVAGAFTPFLALLAVDRAGKGLRTAPRDALIAASAPVDVLGTAFGLHRTLDTAGAIAGPLVAFALLIAIPDRFDMLFLVSFAFAALGVAILVLFVHDRPAVSTLPAISARAALGIAFTEPLRPIALVAGLLALATVADGFVYLALQQRARFDIVLVPLLPVGTAVAYFALALPAGAMSDRLGRSVVFLSGYGLLLLVDLLLVDLLLVVGALGELAVAICVLSLGAFYAATDGVLAAIASAVLPASERATGLAALSTISALARAASALAVGALWAALGMPAAVAVAGLGMCLALAVGAKMLTPKSRVS
jgi:MFS family permease